MSPTHRPLDPRVHVRPYFQLAVCGVILSSLVLTVVFWGPFLWQVLSHQEQLKAWVESYGRYAALVFVAAQVAQVVFFFIPGEVIQIAGGYIFGTWRGLGLSYVGITLGAVMAFAVARLLEQAAIDWLVDRRTVRSATARARLKRRRLSSIRHVQQRPPSRFLVAWIPGWSLECIACAEQPPLDFASPRTGTGSRVSDTYYRNAKARARP